MNIARLAVGGNTKYSRNCPIPKMYNSIVISEPLSHGIDGSALQPRGALLIQHPEPLGLKFWVAATMVAKPQGTKIAVR